MTTDPSRRHLLSLADLNDRDFGFIIDRSRHYATARRPVPHLLDGTDIGIFFRRTSTRTRTAFTIGAQRLGARIIAYGPNDLQENTGESTDDTGRVLSRMLDGLVARTAGDPAELRGWAEQNQMSVVNAMTADEHPTQAFADLCTMLGATGRLDGLSVLYLGEGNNTASALALAMARLPGASLHLRTPRGYGVLAAKLARAKETARHTGAVIDERHDPADLPDTADIVYTTRWQTTGTQKSDPDWRTAFAPFRVDGSMIARYPKCFFMHDLPAHRGEEVDPEVLDGPQSIAFDQAANKLHSAMAVLQWCLLGVG